MKNGKVPTRQQKIFMKTKGLVPKNWLVVKDTSENMEVVSRNELKKLSKKKRTRVLTKD